MQAIKPEGAPVLRSVCESARGYVTGTKELLEAQLRCLDRIVDHAAAEYGGFCKEVEAAIESNQQCAQVFAEVIETSSRIGDLSVQISAIEGQAAEIEGMVARLEAKAKDFEEVVKLAKLMPKAQ